MDQHTVAKIVQDQLKRFTYVVPPSGSTVGVPFSTEKMQTYVERLPATLVEPYVQRFLLRETYEQVKRSEPVFADYWVVADLKSYLEWYDPATGDFGLGYRTTDGAIPISIGVRGDLVSVFAAA